MTESQLRPSTYPLAKCKIVMLGEHNVGKTSISATFMRQPFDSVYCPTIGIDFTARNIDLGDASVRLQVWVVASISATFMRQPFDSVYCPTIGIDFTARNIDLGDASIRLQVWDTAGQERFRSLVPSYIKDCSAALLVYDVTKIDSFDAIDSWVQQILRYTEVETVVIALVGNKVDLVTDQNPQKRQVDKDLGLKKAEQIGAAFFMETSAKTGFNVQNLFQKIAELCYAKKKDCVNNSDENGGYVSVDLQAEIPVQSASKAGHWSRPCC